MTCVKCGKPIPLPTPDPFRCPDCRPVGRYYRGPLSEIVAAHFDAYCAATTAAADAESQPTTEGERR